MNTQVVKPLTTFSGLCKLASEGHVMNIKRLKSNISSFIVEYRCIRRRKNIVKQLTRRVELDYKLKTVQDSDVGNFINL